MQHMKKFKIMSGKNMAKLLNHVGLRMQKRFVDYIQKNHHGEWENDSFLVLTKNYHG